VSGLFVEAARAHDLPVLLEIERASFSHPWTRRNFESELAVSGQGVFFVVRDGLAPSEERQGIRGYCAVRVAAGEMHLLNLTVAEEARRRGLGGFLLDLSLSLAGGRGAREAFLEVREGNAAARALYASRGFSEGGRRRGYYRRPEEDALLLRRPLGPFPPPGDDS
jgi:ribosomal-protein-alanine N-acetyltransferase